MQHEPGCQCGSEPSTEPAPRDVDDLWQPAVAIAGSVRGAQQPPPTIAVLMPEVGLRLTFHASCADPSWPGRRATSSRPQAQVRVGPPRLDRGGRCPAAEGRVVWGSRPGPKHSDTRLRDVQEAAAAHRQTCRPAMARSTQERRHAHGQCHRHPGGRVLPCSRC